MTLFGNNLDQGLATRVQKLQNRAACIITFQGYDVRSAQIQKQLNWEELASYLSDLFSNACENNPYKSKVRNTEYNIICIVPRSKNRILLRVFLIQWRNALEFITK